MRRGLIASMCLLVALMTGCSARPDIPVWADRVMLVLEDAVVVMDGQEAADALSLMRGARSTDKPMPDQPHLGTISLFEGDSLVPGAMYVYDPEQNLLSQNKQVYELRSPIRGGTAAGTDLHRALGDAWSTAAAAYDSNRPSQELLWGRDTKVLVLNPGKSAPFGYHLVGLSVDSDKWEVAVARSWNLAGLQGLPDGSWRFFWERASGRLALVLPKEADVQVLELTSVKENTLIPFPDLSEGLLVTTLQLDRPGQPFSAPITFRTSIPMGATNVRLNYTPLREGETGTFTVDAVVEGDSATAIVPAKHAARIVMLQWEMTIGNKTLRSGDEGVPFGAWDPSN